MATAMPPIERKENPKRFWTSVIRVGLPPLTPATMVRLLDRFSVAVLQSVRRAFRYGKRLARL